MKKALLNQILELTKQQKVALEASDVEQFEKLMRQKQEIMDQIDTLHNQQPELKEEKYEEILQDIIKQDGNNRVLFNQLKEDLQSKLHNMRQQKAVTHVYNNPYDVSIEEGIFYDKKQR